MTLVAVSGKNHVVHIMWKLFPGGSIGYFRATIAFAIVKSQTKIRIAHLVYIQSFQISGGTSKKTLTNTLVYINDTPRCFVKFLQETPTNRTYRKILHV